jgi:hypothetical protein
MLDFSVNQEARYWAWRVLDASGRVLMAGREKSRAEAKYQGERALFLILLTTCPRMR